MSASPAKSKSAKKAAPQKGAKPKKSYYKKKGGWGGNRTGAGRRKSAASGISHIARVPVSPKVPLLIRQRFRSGLPTLRKATAHEVLVDMLCEHRKELEVFGVRVLHYGVRKDQVLYVVEGDDRDVLSRGLQGIGVSLSRRLNRLFRRKGAIYSDRYEERNLENPEALRAAYVQLFCHGRSKGTEPDVYSSGDYFDGWADYEPYEIDEEAPISLPKSALAKRGWHKAGWLELQEKAPRE
ncbi:MAG: hypothetical protein AAF368_03000 [Planctomycetota bacterium]